MTLSFETDSPCQQIAEFLRSQLNQMDTRTVVADVTSYYPFLGGELSFETPLLCVFRGNSSGQQLQTSELNIGYYLFDLAAYRAQTGILRMVEKGIVDLLNSYTDTDQCARFDLSKLSARRGYLPYGDLLLPNTVLSLSFTDFDRVD